MCFIKLSARVWDNQARLLYDSTIKRLFLFKRKRKNLNPISFIITDYWLKGGNNVFLIKPFGQKPRFFSLPTSSVQAVRFASDYQKPSALGTSDLWEQFEKDIETLHQERWEKEHESFLPEINARQKWFETSKAYLEKCLEKFSPQDPVQYLKNCFELPYKPPQQKRHLALPTIRSKRQIPLL